METGNTVNREDMIRYIRVTLESAPVRQLEEVFREILDVLRDEPPEGMTPSEMLEEIEYSMERANDRQIGDAYWIVLSACD